MARNCCWLALIFLTLLVGVRSQQSRGQNLQAKCSARQFRCTSGQCIANDRVCDGVTDCNDGSDETTQECQNSPPCSSRNFRCSYGACVDGNTRCNGRNECADGSDELDCQKIAPSSGAIDGGCKSNQFRCKSGQCIARTELCDGTVNCRDRSDETVEACSDFVCPGYTFKCRYGACIDGNLKCNNVINCADGSDEDAELCGRSKQGNNGNSNGKDEDQKGKTERPIDVVTPRPTSPPKELCNIPDQPEHGEWKLEGSLCPKGTECSLREGVKQLDPGTQLVFRCKAGYKLNGTKDVFCGLQGRWSTIPKCEMIKCPALSSAALEARCKFENEWVSCENPAPIRTIAELNCRNSYLPETTDLTRRDNVKCNSAGEWEPKPMKCVSVCGVPSKVSGKPLIVNGTTADVAEFPWHATLYKAKNTEKQFICGATIIRENLLVTAAHCIFDEVRKTVDSPSKYFVAAGNVFRDYDFELHDPVTVKKAAVKNIYAVCNYLGLEGNYASDIAILEVDKPFVFSSIIMPVCLDVSVVGDQAALEAGNFGKVAGFGRTAMGDSSFILQTISVPYIPLNKCKSSSLASDSVKYITIDKFCAGYSNGSSVCDGDSGGGLVFKTDNKWYLRGIVSVGIGATKIGAVRTCDSYAYSLYTRVSSHMEWIQDMILRVETKKPMKSCL
ncbi:modular serine protease-like [Copidosoma floridanum]|uniref:modular serine protease-like n=1 Tax=Copidosoma floridanum TaxID=29053 RepID=UPI0006C97BF3|nr:modular serine protease-like [Copidosoma floridanum]